MTHLTTRQMLQMVDGTLDYASQAQCTSHLAVCERCRKEIEFQKSITKIARHQPLITTSREFVRKVMTNVIPQRRKSWRVKLVDNLGNIIAMGLVLAVLGYAVTNPSLFQSADQSQEQSIVPQQVTDTYSKIINAFSQTTSDATKKVIASSANESAKMISLTFISLAVLIGLDQFVLKRYLRIRMKH